MSRQFPSSHDFQVQLVPPGVWPDVRCAVTAICPTLKVSLSARVSTCATSAIGDMTPNWGSFFATPVLVITSEVQELTTTRAPLKRCNSAIPPAWSKCACELTISYILNAKTQRADVFNDLRHRFRECPVDQDVPRTGRNQNRTEPVRAYIVSVAVYAKWNLRDIPGCAPLAR